MNTRMKLAALDHNHHLHRKPAKTKDGNVQVTRRWCKKSSQWVCVTNKETKNYSYITPLLALVLKLRHDDDDYMARSVPVDPRHPKNIAPNLAPVQPPSSQELFVAHKSRFGTIKKQDA